MNYLFKNGLIGSSNKVKDIYVENGHIKNIEGMINDNIPNTEIIDLKNRLVLDGFVDSHMHLDKSLINERVANKSGTFDEAIQIMGNYKSKMTVEDIKKRANKVLEMAYKNGTRYIRTHVDVDNKVKLNSFKALTEIKDEWKDRIEMQIVAFPQEGIVDNDEAFYYLKESIKMGADIIGGIPAREKDPIKHINMIFDLALKYNLDIDMHIDETDDPEVLSIKDLAIIALKNDYIGKVTAGHCCSLAANENWEISPIIQLVKKANINIISLPSTNLYLQGRKDNKNIRRGITPIKYLIENNVKVFIASDNIRDPFNPFGNASLLEIGLIAAHGAHMGGEDSLNNLFDMISSNPMNALGFNSNLKIGNKASFIVVDSKSKVESIISQANIYGYFDDEKVFIKN